VTTHDPPRLRSDPTASALLRMALDANVDEPSKPELRGLASALGLAPVPLLVPAASQANVAAKSVAAAKVQWISTVVGPALFGAVTAATVLKVTEPTWQAPIAQVPIESSRQESVDVPAFEPSRRNAPPLAPEPVVRDVITSSPSLSSPRVAATSKERSLPVAPIASAPEDTIARAPAPPPESEILLLERAKARVDSDPQSALALVDEHAVRFPAGMLVQEAEVIAIEALAHAGSTAAAASRLARFRQRFAGSAYLPHLETVIRQKK